MVPCTRKPAGMLVFAAAAALSVALGGCDAGTAGGSPTDGEIGAATLRVTAAGLSGGTTLRLEVRRTRAGMATSLLTRNLTRNGNAEQTVELEVPSGPDPLTVEAVLRDGERVLQQAETGVDTLGRTLVAAAGETREVRIDFSAGDEQDLDVEEIEPEVPAEEDDAPPADDDPDTAVDDEDDAVIDPSEEDDGIAVGDEDDETADDEDVSDDADDEDDPIDAPDDTDDGDDEPAVCTGATIGPAGGRYDEPISRGGIEAPAGTFAEPACVTIAPDSTVAPVLAGFVPVSQVLRFGPVDAALGQLAVVSLPYNPFDLPAGRQPEDIVIFWQDSSTPGRFTQRLTSLDSATLTVRAAVTRLGWGVAAYRALPGDEDDAEPDEDPEPTDPCDDGNACTIDARNDGGGCVYTFADSGAPCPGPSACFTSGVCDGRGQCLPAVPRRCDDLNPCTDDACDPFAGCTYTPNANPCDDANGCTSGDRCFFGLCRGDTPLDCNDDNVCTLDDCLPEAGCVHTNRSGTCDDGSTCTTGDTCSAGVCVGATNACDDANDCTVDSCAGPGGCINTVREGLCDDGLYCTVDGVCVSGRCIGSPRACTAAGVCRVAVCDEANDRCNEQTAPLGTSCDDGNPATSATVCVEGVCRAAPNECPGRPEMALVQGAQGPICMDRFEATVFGNADCSGTAYGRTGDDYPAGFPDGVGRDTNQTVSLYACSVAGSVPSRYITYFQAAQACTNAGKRVCILEDSRDACAGGGGSAYPYGNTYEAGRCVDNAFDGTPGFNAATDVVRAAGRAATCVTPTGIFDLSGNAQEWVNNGFSVDVRQGVSGGSAADAGTAVGCFSQNALDFYASRATLGFRCCADAPAQADEDEAETDEAPQRCMTDPQCPTGSYCRFDMICVTDCSAVRPCTGGTVCNTNRGRCETPEVDEDEVDTADPDTDTEQPISCTTDTQCPAGTYCFESITCVAQCDASRLCTPPNVCDFARGRCNPPEVEEEEEQEPERQCTTDTQCPTGRYCDTGGMCVFDCGSAADCGQGFFCSDRGRCVSLDFDFDVDGDFSNCARDADCPFGSYCNEGVCRSDCRANADCNEAEGFVCSDFGRCRQAGEDDRVLETEETEIIACTLDSQCPGGLFCSLGPNICSFECTASGPFCPSGQVCDPRGRCTNTCGTAGGTCGSGSYCGPQSYCVSDCRATAPCPSGQQCGIDGRCSIIEEFDTDAGAEETDLGDAADFDPDIGGCTSDAQCPSGRYCLNSICTADCTPGQPCVPVGVESDGLCDSRGRCVAQEAEPEPEPEEEEAAVCGPTPAIDTFCFGDDQCSVIQSSNQCVCTAKGFQDRDASGEPRTSFTNFITDALGRCVEDPARCTQVCTGTARCSNNVCIYEAAVVCNPPSCCRNDNDCGAGTYCRGVGPDSSTGQCGSDCTRRTEETETGSVILDDCPAGFTCTNNGRCVSSSDLDMDTP